MLHGGPAWCGGGVHRGGVTAARAAMAPGLASLLLLAIDEWTRSDIADCFTDTPAAAVPRHSCPLSQLEQPYTSMLPATPALAAVALLLLLVPAAVRTARPVDGSGAAAAAALHPDAPPPPRRPDSYSASLAAACAHISGAFFVCADISHNSQGFQPPAHLLPPPTPRRLITR